MNPKRFFATSMALFVLSVLVLQAQPAVTDTWTGSFLNPLWETGENWLSGTKPTFNATTTVIGFGESAGGYYESENTTIKVTMSDLIFLSGAGAYTLYGESIHFNSGTGGRNTIYNLSDEVQTIENNLYITRAITFDTRSGYLIWSGNAETVKNTGTGTYLLTKRGAGEMIVRGNLIPRDQDPGAQEGDTYSKLNWALNGGTLTFDLSSPDFATEKSDFTLTRGTLKVVGSETGTSTLDLGNWQPLSNYYAHNIVMDDSKGGDGTTLRFTEMITGHSSSPGQQLANQWAAVMNIDYRLAHADSAVRFEGLRVQQNKTNEGNPYYTPLRNGIIPSPTTQARVLQRWMAVAMSLVITPNSSVIRVGPRSRLQGSIQIPTTD